MQRTIVDRGFERWEVFASSGPHGFPTPGRLVFRCLSDRDQPSRALTFDGDRTRAEAAVQLGTASELRAYLERAEALG